MAVTQDTLPEGTDTIIAGASAEDEYDEADGNGEAEEDNQPPANGGGGSASGGSAGGEGSARDGLRAEAATLRDRATQAAAGFRDDLTDRVRDYANQNRDRAVGALDGVVKFIDDAAAQVDGTLGSQYGDYARKASETISQAAAGLRDKELEDLLEDALGLVRRSPAIAIGTAAAAGFLLARVIKAGSEVLDETAKSVEGAGTGGAPKKSA